MASRPSKIGPMRSVLTLLALTGVWSLASAGPAGAQDRGLQLEVRAGAGYSTALAETGVRLDPTSQPQPFSTLGDMEVGTGVTPFLGAGVLVEMGYLIWAEVQAGVMRGTVEGEGPAGTWDAGTLTSFHGLGGLRVGLGRGLYARGGVGFLVHSASDVPIFEEGHDTGLLLGAAVGYEVMESLPLSVELEAQRFEFGTTALRRAGAPDASVQRYFVTLAWRFGGGGEG